MKTSGWAAMHGARLHMRPLVWPCMAHAVPTRSTACMQGRQQDLGGAAGLATKHRQASAWGSCLWDCHVGHVGAWLRCSQYGMEWHGMAWRGMTWRGMTWHGMAGAVWMCPRSNNPPCNVSLTRLPSPGWCKPWEPSCPCSPTASLAAGGAACRIMTGSRCGRLGELAPSCRSLQVLLYMGLSSLCNCTLFSQLANCATQPSSLFMQAFDRLDAQCKRMAFTLARATPEERQQQGIGELGARVLSWAAAGHGFIAVHDHAKHSHAVPALCLAMLHPRANHG